MNKDMIRIALIFNAIFTLFMLIFVLIAFIYPTLPLTILFFGTLLLTWLSLVYVVGLFNLLGWILDHKKEMVEE